MEEHIRIKERLRLVVQDKKTHKIIEEKIIEPKVSRWGKFLARILGKEVHATVLDYGKEMAAKLYGGISPAYSIDQIGTDNGGWKSATRTYEAVGTLRVDNSLDPWTTSGQYNWIKCRSSGDTVNTHNSIKVDIDISSGQQWWAEVQFVFS